MSTYEQFPHVAYFYTFTLYGSHVHGDPRGSTLRGHGKVAPNARLANSRQSQMKNIAAPKLNTGARVRFFDEIIRLAHSEKFIVDALNVRTDHFHLLTYPLAGQSIWNLIRIIKMQLSKLAAEIPSLSGVERLWTRKYGLGVAYTYGAWYGWYRYTLFKQGSNTYLRKTQFAKDKNLKFNPVPKENGGTILEPYVGDLGRAFCPKSVFDFRRTVLLDQNARPDEKIIWIDDEEPDGE